MMKAGSAPRTEPVGRPTEVTAGRLVRNTLVNGVANASGAISTLVLTPFFLHRLGAAQYGIWLLALTLTFSSGYLALADLGLPEAAVRFIAEARATGSVSTISEITSSTTAVFAVVGVVIGAIFAGLAPVFVRLFHVNPGYHTPARVVFILVALQVIMDLPTAGLYSVIEGAQQYAWRRSIDVGGTIAWSIAVVVAVRDGHGVTALAIASVLAASAQLAAAAIIAHQVQPGLHIRLRLASRAMLRRILGYGSRIAVLRGLSVIYAQMDRAIIGITLAVAAVSQYRSPSEYSL